MDTFSIIQGIHFSRCSDAGKTYYIINTLYNAINIWCHKSASCLLGLLANGVWVPQSNRTGLICLQREKGSKHLFSSNSRKTPKAQVLSDLLYMKSFFHTMHKDDLSFSAALCHLWYKLKFKRPKSLRLHLRHSLSLLLSHHKTTTLYCWPGAGFPPPLLLQSLDNQFTLTWPG